MPSSNVAALLGEWEAYRIGVVPRFPAGQHGPKPEVWIEWVRESQPLVCSGCGRSFDRPHDREQRWVRHLPLRDAETHVCLQRFRVDCPDCGRRLERLSCLAKHARATRRLAGSVARRCQVVSLTNVAEFYRLSWDAVKRLDKAYRQEPLGEPDLSGLTWPAMDAFAIKRGQRYATIFVES